LVLTTAVSAQLQPQKTWAGSQKAGRVRRRVDIGRHHEDSFGEFEDSKDEFDGDTWRWTTETKMRGITMKSRFTMKMNSATSYNFAYETSPDGKMWTTVIDGTGTKK
jgi:hypothetical protein